jgi:hypothetical protein
VWQYDQVDHKIYVSKEVHVLVGTTSSSSRLESALASARIKEAGTILYQNLGAKAPHIAMTVLSTACRESMQEITTRITLRHSWQLSLKTAPVRSSSYMCMSGKKAVSSQVPVVHTYNPSYSGGRDQEDCGSKPAHANSSWDHILKIPITKRASGVIQSEDPKFKPYGKKKKKKKKGSLQQGISDPHIQA